MKRTGELLRKTREEKGLSVHEVGLFLKINPRILQAIEEGDQTQLPAKTFLRGFVQSYAKFLKLDSNEVLQIFTEEMAPPPVKVDELPATESKAQAPIDTDKTVEISLDEIQPEKKSVAALEGDAFKNSILTKTSNQNDALRIRTFAISIIGLVLVFVIYFVNSIIKKYQKEAEVSPEITATIEASDSKDSAVPANPTSEPAAETPANATSQAHAPTALHGSSTQSTTSGSSTHPVSQAPTPSPTPLKPAAQAPVTSKPSVVPPPAAAPAAKPNPTPPAPVAPAAKPAPSAAAPAAGTTPPATATTAPTAKPAEGKLTEVIVEAKQNVEIEYSSSKSSPQKLALKTDQIHTFKSRSGVKLKISNGGAVNIIVNGQDLGAPGAAGQSIQVSYE